MKLMLKNWMILKCSVWTTLCLCTLLVVQLFMAGCCKDEKEDAKLEVSPVNLQLDDNGEGKLTITSNAKWEVSATADWLSFSTMSGVGDGQVTVRAIGSRKSERTAIVTFKGEGISRQAMVTQVAQKKIFIYGDVVNFPDQAPFQPGAWDAAAMRFSDTEGAHFPTIPDEVYFSLKTLILDVSDAEGCDLKVMNGWWSNTYYDHMSLVSGLNEIQITETMAKECAKGGEGRDLDLMLYSGTCTINAVYYEE